MSALLKPLQASDNIHIYQTKNSLANSQSLVVEGENLLLKPFSTNQLDILENFSQILKNPEAVKMYAHGNIWEDKKIEKLANLDSSREEVGNPFTGYAIIDKASQEVLGRVGLGRTKAGGEGCCEIGILVYPKKHTLEALSLTMKLANYLFQNDEFIQTEKYLKTPLSKIRAITRDSNSELVQALFQCGFEKISTLSEIENDTQESKSLYEYHFKLSLI